MKPTPEILVRLRAQTDALIKPAKPIEQTIFYRPSVQGKHLIQTMNRLGMERTDAADLMRDEITGYGDPEDIIHVDNGEIELGWHDIDKPLNPRHMTVFPGEDY